MKLSLIAMSGSGKSYWSAKLAKHGFQHFDCDRKIASKLGSALTGADGTLRSLGEWMGFPYESGYKERESRYLSYEIEVMKKVLEELESPDRHSDDPIVVDTTGSVIYTAADILSRLKQCTTIIYLATPPEVQEQMLKAYMANPGPVLWRDVFQQEPNETREYALGRCYSHLLSTRQRLYERYADVTIDYYRLRAADFGVSELLNEIHGGRKSSQ